MRVMLTTALLLVSIQMAFSQSEKPLYVDIAFGKSSVENFDLSKEFGYSVSISKSLFSLTDWLSLGIGLDLNEFRGVRTFEAETSTAFEIWDIKSRNNVIGLSPKALVRFDEYRFEFGIEVGYIFSRDDTRIIKESIEKEIDPNAGTQIITESGDPLVDFYVGGTVKRNNFIYPLNFLISRRIPLASHNLFLGVKGYYSAFSLDNSLNTYLLGLNVMYEFSK